jgi:mitochondrial division protein 1
MTSCKLEVIETASNLLVAALPDMSLLEDMCMPSLLCSFEVTVPSADNAHAHHRATHNVDAPWLGLKRLSLGTRGLMMEAAEEDVESKEDIVVVMVRERGR